MFGNIMKQSFKEDVLYLGIRTMDGYYDLYALIMPFINEILNMLTLTILKPYFNLELYPDTPTTRKEEFLKTFIDMLAITGIAANASKYGILHGRELGMLKGSLYAFFTFFIPNLFMARVLRYKSNVVNLAIGIIFIYLLDFTVNAITYLYVEYTTKNKSKEGDMDTSTDENSKLKNI